MTRYVLRPGPTCDPVTKYWLCVDNNESVAPIEMHPSEEAARIAMAQLQPDPELVKHMAELVDE